MVSWKREGSTASTAGDRIEISSVVPEIGRMCYNFRPQYLQHRPTHVKHVQQLTYLLSMHVRSADCVTTRFNA